MSELTPRTDSFFREKELERKNELLIEEIGKLRAVIDTLKASNDLEYQEGYDAAVREATGIK